MHNGSRFLHTCEQFIEHLIFHDHMVTAPTVFAHPGHINTKASLLKAVNLMHAPAKNTREWAAMQPGE